MVHDRVVQNELGMDTVPGLFREGELSQVSKACKTFSRARESVFDGDVFIDKAIDEKAPRFVRGGLRIELYHGYYSRVEDLALLIVRDVGSRQVYFLLVKPGPLPFDWTVETMYDMCSALRTLCCHHVRSDDYAGPVRHWRPGKMFSIKEALKKGGTKLTWSDAQDCKQMQTYAKCNTMEFERSKRDPDVNCGFMCSVKKTYPTSGMSFHIHKFTSTVIIPIHDEEPDFDPFAIPGQAAAMHMTRTVTTYTITNGVHIQYGSGNSDLYTLPSSRQKYSELLLLFGAMDDPSVCACGGVVDHEFKPNRYALVKRNIHKSLWPKGSMSATRGNWETMLHQVKTNIANNNTSVRKSRMRAKEKIAKHRKKSKRESHDGRIFKGAYDVRAKPSSADSDSDLSEEAEEYAAAEAYEKRYPGMLDDRYGNSSEEERDKDFDSDDSESDPDYEKKPKKTPVAKKRKTEGSSSSASASASASHDVTASRTERMRKIMMTEAFSDFSDSDASDE